MVNKYVINRICRITSIVFTFLLFSFQGFSSVNADEGYIGNNKIIIDGIVYEDRDSSFSKIETVTAPGFSTTYNVLDSSDSYSYSETDTINSQYSIADGNTVIPEIGSMNDKIVVPKILCNTPSDSDCIGVFDYSTASAIGEPVNGTYYKQTPLWQKVSCNGKTYYVPVDDIHHIGDINKTNNNKTESVIIGSVLVASKADKRASAITNYMNDYHNIHKYSALDTCAHVYKNADGSVKPLVELVTVLAWCKGHSVNETMIKNKLGISDDKTEGKDFIYLSLDKMLKMDGMSIEGICNGEVTSGSKEYKQSFSSWCKERWAEREQAMKDWMQAHIDGGNTAWDACRLAVQGKENRPDEYKVVIDWCNEHDVTEEEIKKEFSINGIYYAWGNIGSEMTVDPNMDLGPSPYRIVREMGEKAFYIWKDEDTLSDRADQTKNTYIIIHGWNEPYFNKCKDAVWPEDMAASILLADPNAQILRVDWGDIACTNSATQASKWISSITDLTSEALKKWGVNGHKTTIIGFSLGTLAGEELSKKISGSKTIMLDPAEEGLLGYDIDYNYTSFSGFSGDERCIVGASSIFGDETATEDCRENYLVDYYDKHNHSKINELFKKFSINLGKSVTTDKFKNLSRNDIVWSYTVDGTKAMIEAGAKYDDDGYVVLGTVTGFLLDKTIEKGCTVASAGTGPFAPATKLLCDAAISTAIDELQNAIIQTVTEHSWVHETYDTIIEYPFHKNILSLHDQQNFSLMNGGVFNVDHRGMIYTERKQSRSIKYLKTLEDYDDEDKENDKYILYGNIQSNTMECVGDKECIMYGHSRSTNPGANKNIEGDTFTLDFDSNNYTIKDFKSYEEPDKIEIPLKDSTIIHPDPNADISDEPILEIIKPGLFTDGETVGVRIEGFTRSEIRGWVTKARNKDGLLSDANLKKLPIYIQK